MLPEVEYMEIDGPPGPGPSQNDDWRTSAEKSLHESRDHKALARRENKDALRALCQDYGLDDTPSKIELARQLIDWVSTTFLSHKITTTQSVQRNTHRPRNDVEQPVQRSRGVLGKDVLQEVWSDMKLTELPSWMSPAPPNWGTAARGKLTADQWMVVCTVHLPITLIRIWGNLRDRRFSLLCNFMDLTSSVQLADQRAVNENTIRDSEMLMSRYLNTMKTLFRDVKIQPIHHAALHAGDFLRLFGPNHSVRAFGGERYLEVLGLQNVNNKSGPSYRAKDITVSTRLTVPQGNWRRPS